MNRALFSFQTVEWATPESVYQTLDKEFEFDFDPCPMGALFDGLAISWKGKRVYCNPPYGRRLKLWLEKGREADLAVYLLPARTDTRWFHDYALKADEIRFIKGRLRFGGSKQNAPFPSCLVIFTTKEK